MNLLIPIPLSIIACYSDIKTRKIKNYITYPIISMGIFTNFYLKGFEGFKASIIGVFLILFLVSLVPVFRMGGGDLKLAMGYGAFLQKDKALMYFFLFLLLTVVGNILFYLFNKGIKAFLCDVKYEIKSFGLYKAQFDKLAGGPFLFAAYILTLLIY